MAEHTPTPWEAQPFDDAEFGIGIIGLRTNDGIPYSSPTNGLVGWATMLPTDIDAHDTSRAQANAAFIVKAVNNFEALVGALEQTRAALDAMKFAIEASGKLNDRGYISLGIQVNNALDKAGAILSRVGGARE